jgi:hypothetical protein
MATTTPNYGWPVPTSTDLVKDGATAIEALGDAIDATVFGLPATGFALIKTQTIGTTVASVNVTSAFSTTYDAYKIIITGGVGSASHNLALQLGATVTGYYAGYINANYATGSITGDKDNNAASFTLAGYGTANVLHLNVDLQNPFTAKNTTFQSYNSLTTTGAGGRLATGYLANTTSYTDFTLTPSTGTLTGGTIRVYGYKN